MGGGDVFLEDGCKFIEREIKLTGCAIILDYKLFKNMFNTGGRRMFSDEFMAILEKRAEENQGGAILYSEFSNDGYVETFCDGAGLYIIGTLYNSILELSERSGFSFEKIMEQIVTCHKVGPELYITGEINDR